MKLKHTLLMAGTLLSSAVMAQDYHQVSLSSEVYQNIANDEMHASLSKTAQASNAKALSSSLNTALSQAMTLAKKYPNVKVTTGQQNAYPRYNKEGKIIGMTGSVSIHLKSTNFEEAGELMGELQGIMVMDSLSFGVSDETKEKHQKALLQQAVTRFKQDAQDITHAFGAKDYKLVKATLEQQNRHMASPMMASAESFAMAKDASGGVPAMSSGDSTLYQQISGTIELLP